MAAAAIQTVSYGNVPAPRQHSWSGTPEVYFSKSIDNSRLVKIEDPRHARELRQFGIALACLFLFVMAYAFQHFKAIEYGYKIEALKSQRDSLTEMNRALSLEEATLRDPGRIDRIARTLGLQSPQAGQVVRMDVAVPESSGQVVASAMPVEVISGR
jgi:cell division protein FtsL